MKKTVSVILSVVLIICSLGFSSYAKEKCNCGKEPVILVSGFGATTLCMVNDDGSRQVVFPPTKDTVLQSVRDNVSHFNPDTPFLFIGDIVAQIMEPIAMNLDGTSVHNIQPVYSSVEDTSLEGFKRNDAVKYIPYIGSEFLDMECIADEVGEDHVFNFMFDWRLSSDEIADEMLTYIEEVLEKTGHDKVNLFCMSQGSISVSQFLYKYADKGYIDNLVFEDPIFKGSDLVSDILAGPETELFNLNFEGIINLISDIIHTEADLSFIAKVIPEGAKTVAKFGADNYVLPVAMYAPAYLEMVPENEYDRVVSTYCSSPECENLLKETARVRDGYMKDVSGMLEYAQKCGTAVSIVASSDISLATGSEVNSDSIVNTVSSCGAYCAAWGESFDDGYVQKVNTGKNNISPNRTVDLSCGYLPERTWIISGLNHGMIEWASNSLELVETLLYSCEIKDAYSDARFPQFMISNDPGQDFYAFFSNTNCLYAVKDKTEKLVIENTSGKNTMLVNSVMIGDIADSSYSYPVSLLPGERLVLNVNTDKLGMNSIAVNYCESDSLVKLKTKSFTYSVTDNYSGALADELPTASEITRRNEVLSEIWMYAARLVAFVIEKTKNLIASF